MEQQADRALLFCEDPTVETVSVPTPYGAQHQYDVLDQYCLLDARRFTHGTVEVAYANTEGGEPLYKTVKIDPRADAAADAHYLCTRHFHDEVLYGVTSRIVMFRPVTQEEAESWFSNPENQRRFAGSDAIADQSPSEAASQVQTRSKSRRPVGASA